MAKTTKPHKPHVPVFAAVVQPNYAWVEASSGARKLDAKLPSGQTELPILEVQDQASPSYDDVAVITVPGGETPESNAVRIHEMLHAKITPEINAIKLDVMNEGVSELACQFAEDFRVAQAGYELGLWGDDAKYGTAFIAEMARRAAYSEDHQRTFGYEAAALGTLTRAKAVELFCGFVGQPGDHGRIDDPAAFFGMLREHGVEIDADVLESVADDCYGLFGSAQAYVCGALRPTKAFRDLARLFEAVLRDAFRPSMGGGEGEGGEREQVSGEIIKGEAQPKSDSNDADKEMPKRKQESKSPLAGHKSRIGPSSHRTEIRYSRRSSVAKAKAALASMSHGGETEPDAEIIGGQIQSDPFVGSGYDRYKARGLVLGAGADVPESLLSNYSLEPSDIGWPNTMIDLAPVERPRKSFVPKRGKPAMDGDIPRHFGRWIVDRAILDSRGRRPGGTLLIDISGSMSWSREQINALLEEIPALTVALYSSSSRVAGAGQITIVARAGRIVAKDWNSSCLHSGFNLCDGVALSWLCKQPGPRIWLSDGGVTGPSVHGEVMNEAYSADCLRLCAIGAVTLTRDEREVKAILEGRIKQRPVTPAEFAALASASVGSVGGAQAIAGMGVCRMAEFRHLASKAA